MKTILIVGSTGNIGSFLMSYLSERKFTVFGISRTSSSPNSIQCDISRIGNRELSRILTEKKIDAIIHCVAVLKAKTPEDIVLAENVSTKLLLNEVGRTKQHILFGSAAEYGLQDISTFTESTSLNPCTPYGLSKTLQTNSALACFAMYGIRGVIFRLSNVISPIPSQKSLIYKLLAQIANPDGTEILINDFRIERDLIDIRDIAAVVEQSLKREMPDRVYNVCSGQNTTYRSLIQQADAVLRKMKLPPLNINEGDRTEAFNKGRMDNGKISKWLGGYEFHSVESSLTWCIENLPKNK